MTIKYSCVKVNPNVRTKDGDKMRIKVILICSECLARNYVTTKKQEDKTKRLELRKFCPHCNKYTIHKESR